MSEADVLRPPLAPAAAHEGQSGTASNRSIDVTADARTSLLSPLPAATLLITVIMAPASAVAQSVAPAEAGMTSGLEGDVRGAPGEWAFALGAGVGYAPDYEGSEDYEPVPLLFARAQRDEFYLTLEANTLRANLLPSPVFQAGPLIRYRPERDDVDNDAIDALETVDAAVEVGGFVGFEAGGWHGRAEVTQEVADAYDGLLVGVRGGYRADISPNLSLNTTAFTTYASDDYMETYFGIDAADAVRSGLDTFDAEAGFKDVGVSLTARYGGREGFGVTAIAAYKRLLEDAEDSPVVDGVGSPDQLFGGLLVTYGF
ncbi:MAG TPA: MipA/OmpV family protein [Geminicoccaceae bacterium]